MKENYRKLSSKLLIGTLLITGASGCLCYQPLVHADDTQADTLAVTQSQVLNYVDQATGKIVGHQKLTLSKDGKAIADNTKLTLPSGYQRSDKFVYDLSAKAGKDNHYKLDQDTGQVIWNVFVSRSNDKDTASSANNRSVTAVNTTDNHDGSVTVTTTTTTTSGSKHVATNKSDDELIDPDRTFSSQNSSSTSSQGKAQVSSSFSKPSSSASSLTSTENNSVATPATKTSSTNGEQAANSNSGTTGASPTSNESNSSSSNSASSSAASSSAPASSTSSSNGPTSSANQNSGNQQAQTLPQTSADKATPAIEEGAGLGLAGILAGIGLAHLIKRHRNSGNNN